MKRYKLKAIIISGLMMVSLTGCTTDVIELTDTEETIISEYAAHAILEHIGTYQREIVDEMLVEETEEEGENQETDEEIFQDEPQEETVEDGIQVVIPESVPETSVSDNSNNDMSIEDFFGIEGLEIVYKDYVVTKTFPEASEEDFYLSIDATEGNSLLVLKFNAINQTDADCTADMLAYGLKFKVGINDASPRWVLSTMLLNDLTTYNDVIPAGESVELVLAIEVPEETNVDKISLMMKKGENSFTKYLK